MKRAGNYPQRPRLLLVFAHPDDESAGAGGTAALAARRGFTVKLVCATRGEEGKVARAEGKKAAGDLGKTRERELREAARILGIRAVQFLGYRDGALRRCAATRGKERLVAVLRTFRPHVVVTFCPKDGITGHWDHRSIGAWTTAAFKALSRRHMLPKGTRLYWCVRPSAALRRNAISAHVDIGSVAAVKRQALLAHVTQRKDAQRFLAFPEALTREYFRRVVPPWRPGGAFETWIWYSGHEA